MLLEITRPKVSDLGGKGEPLPGAGATPRAVRAGLGPAGQRPWPRFPPRRSLTQGLLSRFLDGGGSNPLLRLPLASWAARVVAGAQAEQGASLWGRPACRAAWPAVPCTRGGWRVLQRHERRAPWLHRFAGGDVIKGRSARVRARPARTTSLSASRAHRHPPPLPHRSGGGTGAGDAGSGRGCPGCELSGRRARRRRPGPGHLGPAARRGLALAERSGPRLPAPHERSGDQGGLHV